MPLLRPWRSVRDGQLFQAQQDTLVKLLLGIERLQPKLIELLLLEKLAEYACDEEHGAVAGQRISESIPVRHFHICRSSMLPPPVERI